MVPEALDPREDPRAGEDGSASSEEPLFATVDTLIGRLLGPYRVVREIGRGAMGVVFEGQDPDSGTRVALKVLPPDPTITDRTVRRFLREAESVARLDHPHIVRILHVGDRGPLYWYAMELLSGRPLDEILEAEGPLPFDRTARLMVQACEAVHFAHGRGIIHRDIKPANILVSSGDRVTVTDFGLARPEKAATLTESGALVGTPIYMSPEQVMGRREEMDRRTDVYALGATLYQVLTGIPPFTGENTQAILQKILEEEPPPPRRKRKGIPLALDAITRKAMEKAAEHRFQSAGEMAEELRRFLSGATVRARPSGWTVRTLRRARRHKLLSGLVIVTVLLLAGYLTNLILFRKETRKIGKKAEALHALDLQYDKDVNLARGFLSNAGKGMNIAAAVKLLTEAVSLFPDRPEAHLLLGKVSALKGDARQAFEEYTRAILRAPGSVEPLLERARFLIEEGRHLDLDEAEEAVSLALSDLQAAMKIDENNPSVLYTMAKTLYECSDAGDLTFEQKRTLLTLAYQYALRAESLGPTALLHCLLAQIHMDRAGQATLPSETRGYLEEALRSLEQARALDRNNLLAARLTEEVERRLRAPGAPGDPGREAKAIAEEQGLGSFFQRAASIYKLLKRDIEATLTDGERNRLVERLIRYLIATAPVSEEAAQAREKPLDRETLMERAAEALDRRAYADAVAYYEKALLLTPPAEAHTLNHRIAAAYVAAGGRRNLDAALPYARLAYAQEPRNGAYMSLLARILNGLGDREGLLALFEEARKNRMTSFLEFLHLPFLEKKGERKVSF